MQLDDPPTAIMYPDDFSYIGGMNQLERMGLSIPDDVSVTGYDGITLSEVLRPKLTTYYQDAEAIGRESARRLVDVIENPKTSIPEKIMVTGRLIEAKKCKTNLKGRYIFMKKRTKNSLVCHWHLSWHFLLQDAEAAAAEATVRKKDGSGDAGKTLNIWCWNDEFQSRFNDYYPEVEKVSKR